MKKAFFLFFVACFLNSCDYYDHRLKIVNKSKNILFFETYESLNPTYPSLNRSDYYKRNLLYIDSSATVIMPGKNGWEEFIKSSENKKLNLAIFKAKDLKKYLSIDTIIKKRLYNMKSISLDTLNASNWNVTIK